MLSVASMSDLAGSKRMSGSPGLARARRAEIKWIASVVAALMKLFERIGTGHVEQTMFMPLFCFTVLTNGWPEFKTYLARVSVDQE